LFKKLLLLFSACFLFAKTIDVDINAQNHRDCKGNSNYYTSIKDAINYASSGDTIEICPGEYNEGEILINKDNLTITSTTGNPDDVVIVNDNNYIFYTKDRIDGLVIKNITLKQSGGGDVFYLQNGGDNLIFENLKVFSESYGFEMYELVSGLVFKNVKADVTKKFLYFDADVENFIFKNNNIESEDYVIYAKSNILGTNIFEDSTLQASKDVIYVSNQLNNVVLKNLYLSSSGYRGFLIGKIYQDDNPALFENIKVSASKEAVYINQVIGDINFTNVELNSSKYRGIYINDSVENFYITDSNINSKKEGIEIDSVHEKLIVDNIEINSEEDGIYIDSSVDELYLTNSTIKATSSGIGLYANQINSYFLIKHNSFFEAKRGIHIENGYADGKIVNNLIQDCSEYGLKFIGFGEVEITQNCFINNAKQAYVDDREAYIDSNCWSDYDGESKTYEVDPIPLFDENPKKDGCNCGDNGNTEGGNIESFFNAIDYIDDNQCNAKDYWNYPIKTKFANEKFNLSILAKDKENNPIKADISKVELRFYSEGDNSKCSGDLLETQIICTQCGATNENGCLSLKDILVKKAYKCVEVYIEGKASENEGEEINSTTSLDNFAIIPYKFVITSSNAKASEEFNILIKALDKNSEVVKGYNEDININGLSANLEYNETKKDCEKGELQKLSGKFIDGDANVTLKYNEVGSILLTIKEKIGSEFAKVDSDDTQERFILSDSKNVNVYVHHFNVKAQLSDYDKFTYLDDTNTIHALIDLIVSPQNKDNQGVKNYNQNCYAKDVDINITLSSVPYNKIIFFNGYENGVSDVNNFHFIISKEKFISNDINLKIFFNFNRNVSVAINPFEVTLQNINVKNEDTSLTNTEVSGKAKFLYGRMFCNDIMVKNYEFYSDCKIAFYDDKNEHEKEIIYYWWLNTLHSPKDGNITQNEIKILNGYRLDADKVDALDIKDIQIDSGKLEINFEVKSGFNTAVVHLLSKNLSWLWYSKYDEAYDISNTSTCKNHFCFNVVMGAQEVNEEKGYIKSGKEVKGPEANITAPPLGIKVFR